MLALATGALSFLAKMAAGMLGSLEGLWRRVFHAKGIIRSRHKGKLEHIVEGIMELVHRELSVTASSKQNPSSLLCPAC